MHAAPSVTYPVGRSRFAALLVGTLQGLGLAAATLWAVLAPGFGWRQAAAFAAVLVFGSLAWIAWLRSPSGLLQWGARWQWQAGGTTWAGDVECALDLQSRMLLRFRPEAGRPRWLWVERKSDPSHWDALRRAVYSRASLPLPEAGKPPPAAEQ